VVDSGSSPVTQTVIARLDRAIQYSSEVFVTL